MRMMKNLILISFLVFSALAQAATYSMSSISLGYGKLDVSSGSGYLYVTTDAQNKLSSISIDVTAGFFGLNTKIKYSETAQSLINGQTLDFYMDGGSQPVLKIKAMPGFNFNGGKLKLSVLKKDGYASSVIEIARTQSSKKFAIWNGNTQITNIGINMRGYSVPDMYVGWYELK